MNFFSTQRKEKILEKFAYRLKMNVKDDQTLHARKIPHKRVVLELGWPAVGKHSNSYHMLSGLTVETCPDKYRPIRLWLIDCRQGDSKALMGTSAVAGRKVHFFFMDKQRQFTRGQKTRFAIEAMGSTYPAKAIVVVALSIWPDRIVPERERIFNGFGEAQAFSKLRGTRLRNRAGLRQTQDKGTSENARGDRSSLDAFDLRETAEF